MSKSDSDEFEDFAEAGNPGDNRSSRLNSRNIL